MKLNRRFQKRPAPFAIVPLPLVWSHCGTPCRVTPWPEVRFERLYGNEWIPFEPGEEALASAACDCDAEAWHAYLEFVPSEIRDFLSSFRLSRMEALQAVARCPGLLPELAETPALTLFVAAHASLRGVAACRWSEIAAVHEHGGLFGLLEWLGLPASRQTLDLLRNLATPDVPRRLLEPLRSHLWKQRDLRMRQRVPDAGEAQLYRWCATAAA